MGHLGPSLNFYQFDASKYLELKPVQSWHYLKSQVTTTVGSGTRLVLPQLMRTWKLVGSLLMVLTLVSILHSRDMPRLTLVCNNVEWLPKYLGVELHGTKGMQAAIQRLAMSGKKAVFALRRRCAELRIFDPALQCQLFDALVKPVLSYGCEVWSDHVAREQLEVVHRTFLKSLLGVNNTTSSYVVLAEFGRFPLDIFWWQQTMRFLSRVNSEVDSDRMLRLAYDVQLQLVAAR